MSSNTSKTWNGLRASAQQQLETRDYSKGTVAERLSRSGLPGGELVANRDVLKDVWIPGVEVFSRQVYQQKGRGYFSELTRLNQEPLSTLGLVPQQWASALMHRGSAKGFHIHPPHIPAGKDAAEWLQHLYCSAEPRYEERVYDQEQWDVMFFLTSRCEFILVDERKGMPRRTMRFTIAGDNHPGPDNIAIIIPPGVAHALMNLGNEDLTMVYGTSTTFNPEWEGRLETGIEDCNLPSDWERYLSQE